MAKLLGERIISFISNVACYYFLLALCIQNMKASVEETFNMVHPGENHAVHFVCQFGA